MKENKKDVTIGNLIEVMAPNRAKILG